MLSCLARHSLGISGFPVYCPVHSEARKIYRFDLQEPIVQTVLSVNGIRKRVLEELGVKRACNLSLATFGECVNRFSCTTHEEYADHISRISIALLQRNSGQSPV